VLESSIKKLKLVEGMTEESEDKGRR
jgi:hypothetical protein